MAKGCEREVALFCDIPTDVLEMGEMRRYNHLCSVIVKHAQKLNRYKEALSKPSADEYVVCNGFS